MRKPKTLILTFALLLGLGLLAGCGGSDSDSSDASADPQEVLDKAFQSGDPITSGVLDIKLDISAEGENAGDVNATVTGPFDSSDQERLPKLDLSLTATGSAEGSDFDFDGGLTLTGDAAYVNYSGQAYEVDASTYQMLQSAFQQSTKAAGEGEEGGSLSQFGIDPSTWLTDLKNEGTEDLDGTEVVHVSGTAQVDKIVSDLGSIAEQTGQADQLDKGSLRELQSSIDSATMDVYANADDGQLRRFDVNLDVSSADQGKATIDASVGIADAGEEQSIDAPDDAKPLTDLLGELPLGLAAGIGGDMPAGGDGGAGSAVPDGANAAEYYDCVQKAKDAEAVQKCADLIGG